jgi:hypothetical protein
LRLVSRHLRTAIRQGLKRSGENTSTSGDRGSERSVVGATCCPVKRTNARPGLVLLGGHGRGFGCFSLFSTHKRGPALSRPCLFISKPPKGYDTPTVFLLLLQAARRASRARR